MRGPVQVSLEINFVFSSMDNQDKPAPTQAGEGFTHQKRKKVPMRVYSCRLRT